MAPRHPGVRRRPGRKVSRAEQFTPSAIRVAAGVTAADCIMRALTQATDRLTPRSSRIIAQGH